MTQPTMEGLRLAKRALEANDMVPHGPPVLVAVSEQEAATLREQFPGTRVILGARIPPR